MSAIDSTTLLPILSITDQPPTSFTGRNLIGVSQTNAGVQLRWTVIGWFGKTSKGGGSPFWWCRCECGTVRPIIGTGLLVGSSLSCGCLMRENVGKRHRTHGCSSPGKTTPEYKSWRAMKRRCYDPNDNHYENYGGRGVTICDAWKDDFAAFLRDMGPMPSGMSSIDRFPDQDGNYVAGNCRWSNRHEQSRNKRTNVMIPWRGETKCITDWAEGLGIKAGTLKYRIREWGLERAMTTPKSF